LTVFILRPNLTQDFSQRAGEFDVLLRASAGWTAPGSRGVIGEVYLCNYGLTDAEVRALYQTLAFKITSVAREGSDLRLTWACAPGRSYVVQTNAATDGGVGGPFGDLSANISVPAGFAGLTTNYLHQGVLTNTKGLCYRVKLLE
jgi:hypothetical protein